MTDDAVQDENDLENDDDTKRRVGPDQFEIGLIYSDPNKKKFYLAVAHHFAVGMVRGKVVKLYHRTALKNKYLVHINMPVGALVAKWKVPLQFLDSIAEEYLALPRQTLKSFQASNSSRAARKQRGEEKALIWRRFRSVALTA